MTPYFEIKPLGKKLVEPTGIKTPIYIDQYNRLYFLDQTTGKEYRPFKCAICKTQLSWFIPYGLTCTDNILHQQKSKDDS